MIGDVYIDVNGDGKPDYDLYITDYSVFTGNPAYDDVYVAALCKISTSMCSLTPLNGVTPDVLDTAPMDTNVVILPVAASDLGLAGGKSKFDFYFNRTVGAQAVHSFDPVHPGLSFGGAFAVAGSGLPVFPDLPSQSVQVSYSQSDYTADKAAGILLLHHHNGAGSHAQSIATEFGPCSVSATATVPTAASAGEAVRFQASPSATSCTGDASYAWDFGDGSGSAVQNPSHVYAAAGAYGWRLVVSYGNFSVTRTGSITVTGAAGEVRRRLHRAPPG